MTKDLIARLENAKGPDRELDAEIAKHLGWVRFSYPAEIGWYDESGMCCDDCPRYTGSIDAARGICEDNAFLFAAKMGGEFQVRLRSKMLFECKGIAATLELSWCIAALKAMEE